MKKVTRLSLVEHHHPEVSIVRQCRLLGISRSSVYYQSRKDLIKDLELMRLIDEQYLKTPYYGSRRMRTFLRSLGCCIESVQTAPRLPLLIVERLSRSVKYKCVYLKAFDNGAQLKQELKSYFQLYNSERPHQGLDDNTLDQVYFKQAA